MRRWWTVAVGLGCLLVLLALLPAGCSDSGGLSDKCAKDEECGAGRRCDTARGVCVNSTLPPALKDQAKGTFECERYAALSTPPPQQGPTKIDIEVGGTVYQMRSGCAFYSQSPIPNSTFLYLSFIGNDTALTKDVWLDIFWRPEDNKAGTLSAPAPVTGWLRVTEMGQTTQVPTALLTSGTVTIDAVAAQDGETIKGSVDLKVESFQGSEIGTYCETPRPCDAKCTLSASELKSTTCKAREFCMPYQNGTRAGFCTNECVSNPQACDASPGAECVKTAIGDLCFKKCAGASDCTAPLVCASNGYCGLN